MRNNSKNNGKHNNRLIIFAALLIFFLSIERTASAAGVSPEGNAITISMLNQEPSPVDSGQYVKLKFRVENIGGESLKNVVVEIIPAFPFSLDPGASGRIALGTIGGGQTGVDSLIIEYRLRVDEKAISGLNEIKLRYSADGENWVTLSAFNVNVRRSFPGLSIESISSEPLNIAPGKYAILKIEIKNLADSAMKDVSVGINLSSSSIPFIPIGSGTEKKAYQIAAGETKSFEFGIMASPDAATGVYKVPLFISYRDEGNANHTKSDIAGVIVNSEPVLSAEISSSAITTSGTKGKITVKIINEGTGDVKFLKARIDESPDYKILSAGEYYIGELASDDYDTADFTIYAEKTKEGSISIPLKLIYSDAIGNRYEKIEYAPLRIYTSAEMKKFGMAGTGSGAGIIITLLIVAAGVLLYKNRKRIRHLIRKK
ncbi:MAG: COG1361 S-layer family protein [Candidatus Woesearchaeota archaeon]|nr:COG1361 S-layer family protein [Candidatus Woesearchaeota archaeon]